MLSHFAIISIAFSNKVVERVINQWNAGDIVQHIITIHFLQSEKCKTPLELELI